MYAQFFKKKWLTEFRQMSHLKVESNNVAESSSTNENGAQVVNNANVETDIVKEEEDVDENMDDQMTVVGSTLNNSGILNLSVNDKAKQTTDNEVVQQKTPTQAGRISTRRSTMAAVHVTPPASASPPRVLTRKRRNSEFERPSSSPNTRSSPQNRAETENDAIAPAKRMRHNSSTGSNSTSKPTDELPKILRFKIPPRPLQQNSKHGKSPAPASTNTRSPSQKLKKPAPKNQITQYFGQKSQLKCDKCGETVKSQKELNFHLKVHNDKRCIKCKKSIKNDSAEIVRYHMISCLLLSNKMPKELLKRLLKVKVDLNRLTPRKVEEIRTKISVPVKTNDHDNIPTENVSEPEPKQKPSAEESKTIQAAQEQPSNQAPSDQTQADQTQPDQAPADELLSIPTATSSKDGSAVAERSSAKKKVKRTPKTTQNDINDEITIVGSQSAALYWKDDEIKDKALSMKNFDKETKSYRTITDLPINSPIINSKIVSIVNKIKLYKQRALQNKDDSVFSMPLAAVSPAHNGHSGHNGHNGLMMPSTPNAVNVPSIPSGSTVPSMSTTVVPNVPNVPNTARIPTTPTLPQLLSKPSEPPPRRPLRSRAMSMHFSNATEFQEAARLIGARRKSCYMDNPNQSPTHKLVSLDHAYANNRQENPAVTVRHVVVPSGIAQNYMHRPPPFMTHVHNMVDSATPSPLIKPASQSTLKVLSVDDVNSRAMNVSQPNPNLNNSRSSPSATENNTNLNNNNNQPPSVKRPRTKTTPMRSHSQQISDDENVSINVSLSRVSSDEAELSLTLPTRGRLCYDNLTHQRKKEVQSSLLRDDVWLQMLTCLTKIRPTNETLELFGKILPEPEKARFFTEIKKAYANRSG